MQTKLPQIVQNKTTGALVAHLEVNEQQSKPYYSSFHRVYPEAAHYVIALWIVRDQTHNHWNRNTTE